MSNATDLRLAADILDRVLPSECGTVAVFTHRGLPPKVNISEQSFRTMFAGSEAVQEPLSLETYTLTAEMFGVQFSAVGYYTPAEVPQRRTVMV